MRLPEETSVKMALEQTIRAAKKIKCGEKPTWLNTMEKDPSQTGYTLKQASELAKNRLH